MANYRYVYEYGGKRYVIEAPQGATEDDLQAIISGASTPAPAQVAKAPAPKKEEESFLSGVLPTLKKSAGEIGEGFVNLIQRLPSSASLFDPILGEREIPERPVVTAIKGAVTGLRERGEAELPQASIAERARQAAFIKEAKPGLGSEILASLSRPQVSPLSVPSMAASFLAQKFLPQTPEEAAKTIAKVQAPFQTARGASEFIAEQTLPTLIPLGLGKGAQIGTRALRLAGEAGARRAAGAAAVGTSTAINAASAGQQAYRDVIDAGGTEEEAQRAFNIAAGGAAATSTVAARLPGLEQQVFAGAPAAGGIIRGAVRAAKGEIPQEFVEESGTQLATNVAKLGTQAEVPIGEDVLSSGILGGIAGGALAAPVGGIQGYQGIRTSATEEQPGAGINRATPPLPPSAPPPDMSALAKALGPVGGKVTLQEPSGPQDYIFQGFDEDGSVLLADDAGNVFAEDPAQVAEAVKSGVAEPEEGLGGIAFGMDVTEDLPDVEAPVTEAPAESIAPPELMPIDEDVAPYIQDYARFRTAGQMRQIEDDARRIASERGAASVSKEDMSQAAIAFDDAMNASAAPKATAAPSPAPEAVRTVTTPGGTKVNTAFEVVDAKDLKAATGDLQNRDRSRAATDVQVQDIFSNFDPQRLGESLESDRGSPIIGPDNIVESGNGRVMAINKVYDESPERAQAYRDFIEAQGYDTKGFNRPILVRRRLDDLTPESRAQFVRESNMDTKLRLSTSEQAGTDAAALTPDVMALMASPDVNQAVNRDFVRGFLSKMPTQEQAAFLDKDGNLSAEGSRRLRTAIKASAYGDADLINTLDEAQDNNIKSIGGALEDAAPNWRSMRADIEEGLVRPEMDVTDQLVEAAKIVRDVRNRGQKINDFLSQQDAFNPLNPVTERFIRSFYNAKSGKAAGRDAIADVLNKYARRAKEQTAAEQLIATEKLTPEQILDGITKGEGPMLFQSFEPIPVEQQQEVIDEARKIPSLSRGVTKLIKQRDKQLIDDAEFASRVTELADFIEYMKDERNYRVAQRGRVRGADRILEVLLAAKRRGEISPEAVDFIAWALKNNPNLANDLAVSMRAAKGEGGATAYYTPVSRLMTLFKNRGSDSTAVHELLHHTERMMPEDAQKAIRATWLKELNKEAAKYPSSSPQNTFFKAIRAFHSQSKINFAGEVLPSKKGMDIAMNLIEQGYVPSSYYQYVNPSEFWAVNATDIMQKRYDVKDSTLGRMRNWLSELVEKAKGLFGLSSKSPLIKALDSLAKADGKFNSLNMLQEEGARYMDASQPEEGQAGNIVDINAKRNAEIMDVARAISKDPKAANLRQLEGVIDLLDEVYASPNKALSNEAARIQDQLMEVESQVRAGKTPLNDNAAETELQKAEREYDKISDEYNKFFYNPDDERAFADRRTKAFKEWAKEEGQLAKAYKAATDRYEKALAKEKEDALETLNEGTPGEMKKAIAKVQEPDDKIMNERANLQKQNRGCD